MQGISFGNATTALSGCQRVPRVADDTRKASSLVPIQVLGRTLSAPFYCCPDHFGSVNISSELPLFGNSLEGVI